MSFYLPKIVWMFTDPLNILLALLCLGVGLRLTRWRRAGATVLTVCAVLLIIVGILPVGSYMVAVLEDRFPPVLSLPQEVHGVIVLGGALQSGLTEARGLPSVNDNGERLFAFAELARRYPRATLVFSGGSGLLRPGRLTEADVAVRVFKQIGLDTDRVLFEGKSRNTNEHPGYIANMVRMKPGETWLLVTSAFHMPRAVGVFRAQGWNVTPYPTDFRSRGLPGTLSLRFNLAGGVKSLSFAFRAWAGLIAYRLMGRTHELLPGPAAPVS